MIIIIAVVKQNNSDCINHCGPNRPPVKVPGIKLSNQFDNAMIKENIAISMVIGVKNLCSNLFLEIAFPTLFNRNKPVINHKA